MADNPLHQLEACGTAVWNDFIRRSFVTSGELKRLVEEDGISGVTSNPTIFEKAIGGSSDYDDQLKELARQDIDAEAIFREMASTDIQMAADVLRPVYDRTKQHDGFISVEVSPAAAHDTQRTLDDAHFFWTRIDRPNIMIKVPATPEGIPAIEQLISEGINVNITLIFAVEVYEQVMDAYLKGLERRVEANQPVGHIASVASFFVSRVDTLVDKLLEEKAKTADAGAKGELQSLEGKAAVANAKIAYESFQRVFESDRFKALEAKGAQVQRPLWASTSTKNPNYPDTMYVDDLVGKEIVNTMPPQTIVAVRDHGKITCDVVTQGVDVAHAVFARLKEVGIDMKDVTDQLTAEGVKSFQDSQTQLFDTIRAKVVQVRQTWIGRDRASLDGAQKSVDSALQKMTESNFLTRLWEKDPALWKPNPGDQNEITDRLGWLHVSDSMLENRSRFTQIAQAVKEEGFTHAVVLGMGGSSLAPYVFSQTFGKQPGFPELLVLDSTDPAAILDIEQKIDLEHTLFLVSTKSGTTTETVSFFETFWEKVKDRTGENAGKQFVAITDPGTPLEKTARDRGFRTTFLNPADIGGRYSALSYFGLVPAAVAGIDVEKLLDRALGMEHACAASVPADRNPGAWLGAIMAELAKAGRDKVTFFLSSGIETLGLWLEQLLAESTGKEGKGLIPVPDNPPGDPSSYAGDHLFVYIQQTGANSGELDKKVQALEGAGKPVVRLQMGDEYDLGAEFFRWEFATATAGALLGINAFDQPNVQESKDNTKRVLQEFESSGALPEPKAAAESAGVRVFVNGASQARGGTVEDVVSSFMEGVKAPQYVALMAYILPSPTNDTLLEPLRVALRDSLDVAVTLGYGPRFLHSTGQLHKGGPPEGVFIQITADASQDVPVPGEKYTYQTLIHAQALGDFESLQQHGRPALRVHLPSESADSIRTAIETIERAVRRQPAAVG